METTDWLVNGVRSAVHQAGEPGSAEAVVFVHGNPGPMDDWEAIAPHVASLGRVIAVDMPGFGRADRPRGFDFSVEGYARHLGGLLDQLGVRRAHLVLHDFGGAWGLRWAVDHPHALASVTLIDTVPLTRYRWHTFARIWQTPGLGELLQAFSGPLSIRAVMNLQNPRPLPRRFTDRVLRYADWEQKLAVLALYRASKDADATFGTLPHRLRSLDVPACVIWGGSDPYVPPEHAEAQREIFPRAEVHVLDGLGHWPFVDDPDAVRDLVVSFLARQLAS